MRQSMQTWAILLLVFMFSGGGVAAEEASTDLSGFYTIARGEDSAAAKAFIDELPDDVVLLEDTGAREFGVLDFGGLKPKPHAIEEAQQWDAKAELLPENACKVPSVIYVMQAPFPIEIDQGRDIIVIRLEYYDQVRVVYMDGRDHLPDDIPHSGMGHSVGHWEGKTLVVETADIKEGTIANNGLMHTDEVRLTERFRLSPDGQQLWMTQVFEDPANLDNRGARFVKWRKVAGQHVYPYECDPFSYTESEQ